MSLRKELLAKAKGGDARAQLELGIDYDNERPINSRRAVYWYRKAAGQGNAEAQNLYGECLRNGESVKRSRKDAVVWFRSAAKQGNADGQTNLGYCLFYGEGVKQNQREGLHWYRKAAKSGHKSAQFNIAQMYRMGDVLPQNWKLAIIWYHKAAENGNVGAMNWLCDIYSGETGHPRDLEKQFDWQEKAAFTGDAESQCNLGVLYFRYVVGNHAPILGAYYYRLAADKGYPWAYYLLGLCYRDGTGVKRNARWAKHWFAKAASNGVIEARKQLRRYTATDKVN